METNMQSATNMATIMSDVIKMLAAMLASQKEKINDARTELMKKCAEMIKEGEGGGFKLFSNEDAAQIEEMLVKSKIPFLPVANGNNTMIIIPEKYEGEFLRVQEMFRFTDLNYYKDIDELTLLSSIDGSYDRVPKLEYGSIEAASLAKEKLFASGITCSMEKNDNGSYDILLHPNCMFKPGNHKDYTDFELLMAYEQSKDCRALGAGDEWKKIRLEQALYDEGRINEFARRAANGENVVLSDLSPDKENKFFIEAGNGRITINFMNNNGDWRKDIIANCENMTPDAINKFCSRYTEKIHNMGVISKKEYNDCYKGKIPEKDYRSKENIRPEFINNKLENFGGDEIKPLLEKIGKEAGKAAANNGYGDIKISDMKQVSAALTYKRKFIVEKLRNSEDKDIKEFINSGKSPLSAEQKQAWLIDIAKRIEGSGGINEMSASLTTVSIKDAVKKAKNRNIEKEAVWQAEKEVNIDINN